MTESAQRIAIIGGTSGIGLSVAHLADSHRSATGDGAGLGPAAMCPELTLLARNIIKGNDSC
jgi:hypothetical protein